MIFMENVMEAAAVLPLVRQFGGIGVDDLIGWYRENTASIDEDLLEVGGVLLRGADITNLEKFETVINSISTKFLDYRDGNSPRTKLSSSVYTSTEFDQRSFITLHNELSYSNRYPSRIFFCCIRPAASGGETPIADCRRVLMGIDPGLVARIERDGIRYIRNLHGGIGLGPSWQYTFQTTERSVVEQFCSAGDTQFEWKADGGIRLIQQRPGIVSHPVTGQKVWFSQIDQFHPFHLEHDQYELLMSNYEGEEEDMPMYVTFGDKGKIPNDMITHIGEVVKREARIFSWKSGDLLVLDNILVSHGRNPYEGERKVLVAMA